MNKKNENKKLSRGDIIFQVVFCVLVIIACVLVAAGPARAEIVDREDISDAYAAAEQYAESHLSRTIGGGSEIGRRMVVFCFAIQAGASFGIAEFATRHNIPASTTATESLNEIADDVLQKCMLTFFRVEK